MGITGKKHVFSAIGVFVTVLCCAAFIWAAFIIVSHYTGPHKPGTGEIHFNEKIAYINLKHIRNAQEHYIKTDWDRDGLKTYSQFFVHLWKSVNLNSEPVKVELINRKLAFSLSVENALNGYYFQDLHYFEKPESKGQSRPLDYTKEWAVMSLPEQHGITGNLVLITGFSGDILAKDTHFVPLYYPHNYLDTGWKKIDSMEDLVNLQKPR